MLPSFRPGQLQPFARATYPTETGSSQVIRLSDARASSRLSACACQICVRSG